MSGGMTPEEKAALQIFAPTNEQTTLGPSFIRGYNASQMKEEAPLLSQILFNLKQEVVRHRLDNMFINYSCLPYYNLDKCDYCNTWVVLNDADIEANQKHIVLKYDNSNPSSIVCSAAFYVNKVFICGDNTLTLATGNYKTIYKIRYGMRDTYTIMDSLASQLGFNYFSLNDWGTVEEAAKNALLTYYEIPDVVYQFPTPSKIQKVYWSRKNQKFYIQSLTTTMTLEDFIETYISSS